MANVAGAYKIKHRVYTRWVAGEKISADYRKLIKSAVLLTLEHERVDLPCVVCVLITDDMGIRRYNREYRDEDKPTDVLSFPMQEFLHPGWAGVADVDIDLETGMVPLGDVIISTETIKRQSDEFSSPFMRETALMIIHSTLHLLGYDHFSEESEEEMRSIEVKILEEITT